jgi:hypothetical protein
MDERIDSIKLTPEALRGIVGGAGIEIDPNGIAHSDIGVRIDPDGVA